MDPQGGDDSRRRAPGREGKQHRGKQLGLKRSSAPAPSLSPVQPSQPPISTLDAPNPTPLPAPNPTVAAPSSSPAAPMSTMPPWSLQGAGWGAVPPNFAFLHGNQQGPNSWGYPPEGFVNLIQQNCPPQPQQQGENFHFVGQSMTFNPISPPPPPRAHGTPSPQVNNSVEVLSDEDENNDASMGAKKRTLKYWTHEEEERLANAWLNASKDSIHGNDKKGDTFWKEVTDVFNKKGNGKHRRELNQLKVHWSRLKSSIGEFNDYWSKVTQMNTSGYSEDMLEEEAQKMYANKFGKPFPLVHWWKILRKEPKWCAQFEKEKDKAEVVDIPEEHRRPIGREAAKAERNGKRKKDSITEGIVILGDNIEKIIKVKQDRNAERKKVTEAQIHISNVNLKAAEQQKEAKMFEVYNSLLNQDTSNMSEEQKARRDKALHKLEEKLFAD